MIILIEKWSLPTPKNSYPSVIFLPLSIPVFLYFFCEGFLFSPNFEEVIREKKIQTDRYFLFLFCIGYLLFPFLSPFVLFSFLSTFSCSCWHHRWNYCRVIVNQERRAPPWSSFLLGMYSFLSYPPPPFPDFLKIFRSTFQVDVGLLSKRRGGGHRRAVLEATP